ncbi:Pimeloyl-ACP methyl ester carboxylesterase [Paraburkholderia fungorum]|uniref:Pimeloyl-ACP methyl ester carboxylesterase n=1 Tax=Paraburkholderia fungorum TaxID=134537 RepID=A0A1H1K022_9BURK|nr:alpha/beta hydrolase [Paraburkholderia fungorum]SDR55412.1 Pimeloyl-ACP methyl ester carboxylesterase [Paraburkholderia fungorum]
MINHIRSKDGTSIGYSRTGAGPALVLVHGTTVDRHRWRPVLAAFERHFTVFALDRRGRGDSGDSAEYAIEKEFDDVAALVDATGESAVSVVAHSFGAVAALEAATRTSSVDKLVLYEPPFRLGEPDPETERIVETLRAHIDDQNNEAALATFFSQVLRLPEAEISRLRVLPNWSSRVEIAATIAREMGALQTYRPSATALEKVAVPVLLLLGSASPPKYIEASDYLLSILKTSSRVVLEGQGHGAIDADSALFGREVLSFLLADKR